MSSCSVGRFDLTPGEPPISESTLLSDHTTIRVGGPADRFVVAHTEAEAIEVVTACDERGIPVLVLGGGSNILVADAGFPGVVVRLAFSEIRADVSDCGGAAVRVGAGVVWDDFVSIAVRNEWSGIEALSGIPGSVGATPIQNVGAYGCEVSQTITSVRTWDRFDSTQRTFALDACGFGYRTSRFKREPDRYLVLEVGYQFPLGDLSQPIAYSELAARLGVHVGERVASSRVREVVLSIRAEKGMVLDPADHDTWSAGSFFTNPVLDPDAAAKLPADAPRFATSDGRVKTSAAWLIQHAGFPRGYGTERAGLSTRHVLALTNRGGATADDLVDVARRVRDGVAERFGIALEPEVNLVGVQL